MSRPLRIAIFSGIIPSTTFIEHLIEGMSKTYQIYLFGVVKNEVHYPSNQIKIFKTPKAHIINLLYTIYRVFILLLVRPKAIFKLAVEIKKYERLYDKWIWFSKFLPMVLYKPDILHLQWARDLEFYTFLKTEFNIKIIVSLRGAHINYTPIVQPRIAEIYRKTFQLVDGFHAVSQAVVEEAKLYYPQLKNVKVIHSPLPEILELNGPKDIKSKNKRFKIGSVGRFHWIKGMNYAIQACGILKERGFDFEYVCISSNKPSEADLFQINQLGLNNYLRILGAMNQETLFKEMKTFDILVLPSMNEGIANVVLEAMALGIPVISTNCGGMNEVVLHGETGWLVPIRDAQAIADAVFEIYGLPIEKVKKITQKAHEYVHLHFDRVKCMKEFMDLYDNL